MNDHSLHMYLFEGEGETLEFKQTLNDKYKIAKTLCAFANTRGGVLLVGVKDNKTVVGVDPEEEKHVLEAAEFLCQPPIPLQIEEIYWEQDEDEELTILKISVAESTDKPHYAGNRKNEMIPYLRHQDKTLLAGPRAIQAMKIVLDVTDDTLSKNEIRLLDYLRKNGRISVKKYMELVNISLRRARRELNEAMDKGLIRPLQHEQADYYVI